MNKSEEVGYRWLVAQGYVPDDIIFRRHRSPDFLTSDGRGWEVKLARRQTVTIYSSQLDALRDHPDTSLIVVSDKDEPDAIIPFKDVTIGGYVGLFRFVLVASPTGPVVLIRGIERDVARRFSRGARARGITLGAYLERLVDLYEKTRLQAASGDRVMGAVLTDLGLEAFVE